MLGMSKPVIYLAAITDCKYFGWHNITACGYTILGERPGEIGVV